MGLSIVGKRSKIDYYRMVIMVLASAKGDLIRERPLRCFAAHLSDGNGFTHEACKRLVDITGMSVINQKQHLYALSQGGFLDQTSSAPMVFVPVGDYGKIPSGVCEITIKLENNGSN